MSWGLTALAGALVLLGPEPAAAGVRARLDSRPGAQSTRSARRRDPATSARVPSSVLPILGALGCAVICVLVAGPRGAIAAVAVVPAVFVVLRRQIARAPAAVDAAARASLPLVCDLVAAGLRAGASAPTALSGAAATASGSVRIELARVAALLRLGTSAADAWVGLVDDPVLGQVAAVAARSADSGIRLADALTRAAATLRDDLHSGAVARAERVGVMALIPLGLCFLPAFICLGVVPIVAGVAAEVFGRVTS